MPDGSAIVKVDLSGMFFYPMCASMFGLNLDLYSFQYLPEMKSFR